MVECRLTVINMADKHSVSEHQRHILISGNITIAKTTFRVLFRVATQGKFARKKAITFIGKHSVKI